MPSPQQVRGGTSFAAAAAQAGFAAADVTFADQTQQPVRRRSRTPTSPHAAFAARAGRGGRPDPLAELGYHVVRVEQVTTGRRGRSNRCAARSPPASSSASAPKRSPPWSRRSRSRSPTARASRKWRAAHGLTIVTTPPVTAPGQPVGGSAWHRRRPSSRRCCAAAFEIDAEDPEPAIETIAANERFALLGVERVEPAAPPPLAQIRDAGARPLDPAQRARQRTARSPTRSSRRSTPARRPPRPSPRRSRAAACAADRPAPARHQPQGQQMPPPLIALFSLAAGHAPASSPRRTMRAGSSSLQQSVARRRRRQQPQLIATSAPSSTRTRRRGELAQHSPARSSCAARSSATRAAIRARAAAHRRRAEHGRAIGAAELDPRPRQL